MKRGCSLADFLLSKSSEPLVQFSFMFYGTVIPLKFAQVSKQPIYKKCWTAFSKGEIRDPLLIELRNKTFDKLPLSSYRPILDSIETDLKEKIKYPQAILSLQEVDFFVEIKPLLRTDGRIYEFVESVFQIVPFKMLSLELSSKEPFVVKAFDVLRKLIAARLKISVASLGLVLHTLSYIDYDVFSLEEYTKVSRF